ncbi:MAG: TonB-dependent receptor [Gammaproteobacteria bacterium]|nr:MAG: TonB-dependent receptor [Gammaproteobacteria bacterium]
MKRVNLLAWAVACASTSVIAATNDQAPGPIEHVLVSVPMHKKAAETALPVTVLAGEELRRQAANSIGETLANKPGLAKASFGPGVGQPVIRGQSGARVSVLQNGTLSADASNLSADHAVSVEPLLADSIEVLRGPATLLYGGGAIGGVINVIDGRVPTATLDGAEVAVEARHDTASAGHTVVARIDAGDGRFVWHVDGLWRNWGDMDISGNAVLEHREEDDGHGEYEQNDHEEHASHGVLANSDGRTRSGTIGGAWHFDSGFVGLAVNRLENKYGIPEGGHGAHGDEHEEDHEHGAVRIDLEQTRYDMVSHVHQPLPGLDVVRSFLSYTDYRHVELEGGEIGTRYANESWEFRTEAVREVSDNRHGSFGLQVSNSQFSAEGEEAFIPKTDSRSAGLFVVQDYHFDNFSLEGGLRYDYVKRDPDSLAEKSFAAFSVSTSVLYELSPEWQLGLALHRAERAPAPEELYSNTSLSASEHYVVHAATGTIEVGDVSLDTEVSNNIDVSINWDGERLSSQLTLFYNDFSDYIYLRNTGAAVHEVPVMAYQQADARFYGIEWTGLATLAQWRDKELLLELNADSIRGRLAGAYSVPRLPPVRVGARLSWSSSDWLVFGRVLKAAAQDRPGLNEEATSAYTRWDAGIEYRGSSLSGSEWVLFANANNITDEDIRLSTSFLRDYAPEPGRSVEVGLRLML